MNLRRGIAVSLGYIALTISGVSFASADSIFNFNSDTTGKTTPFTDTVGGLSATFTGKASVCDISTLGFVSLSGNALIQSYCVNDQSGPISTAFSANLSSVSFDFATAGGGASVTFSAYENGSLVGTLALSSSVPPGHYNGEGFADFSGVFNSFTLSSSDLLAIDNIDAVTPAPEPVGLAGIGLGIGLFPFVFRRKRA